MNKQIKDNKSNMGMQGGRSIKLNRGLIGGGPAASYQIEPHDVPEDIRALGKLNVSKPKGLLWASRSTYNRMDDSQKEMYDLCDPLARLTLRPDKNKKRIVIMPKDTGETEGTIDKHLKNVMSVPEPPSISPFLKGLGKNAYNFLQQKTYMVRLARFSINSLKKFVMKFESLIDSGNITSIQCVRFISLLKRFFTIVFVKPQQQILSRLFAGKTFAMANLISPESGNNAKSLVKSRERRGFEMETQGWFDSFNPRVDISNIHLSIPQELQDGILKFFERFDTCVSERLYRSVVVVIGLLDPYMDSRAKMYLVATAIPDIASFANYSVMSVLSVQAVAAAFTWIVAKCKFISQPGSDENVMDTQASETEDERGYFSIILDTLSSLIQKSLLSPVTLAKRVFSWVTLDLNGIIKAWRAVDSISKLIKFFTKMVKDMYMYIYCWYKNISVAHYQLENSRADIGAWMREVSELYVKYGVAGVCIDAEKAGRVKDLMAQANEYLLVVQQTFDSSIAMPTMLIFNKFYSQCKEMYEECSPILSAQAIRPAPFSIYLYGKSGIGKSTITSSMIQDIHEALNIDFDPLREIYTRNISQDHWDGFSPAHKVVVVDDIFQNTSEETVSKYINELTNMHNTSAYVVEAAEIGRKGNVGFKASTLVMTSNINPDSSFLLRYQSEPVAFLRRRDLVFEVLHPGEFLVGPNAPPLQIDGYSFVLVDSITGRRVNNVVPMKYNEAVLFSACRMADVRNTRYAAINALMEKNKNSKIRYNLMKYPLSWNGIMSESIPGITLPFNDNMYISRTDPPMKTEDIMYNVGEMQDKDLVHAEAIRKLKGGDVIYMVARSLSANGVLVNLDNILSLSPDLRDEDHDLVKKFVEQLNYSLEKTSIDSSVELVDTEIGRTLSSLDGESTPIQPMSGSKWTEITYSQVAICATAATGAIALAMSFLWTMTSKGCVHHMTAWKRTRGEKPGLIMRGLESSAERLVTIKRGDVVIPAHKAREYFATYADREYKELDHMVVDGVIPNEDAHTYYANLNNIEKEVGVNMGLRHPEQGHRVTTQSWSEQDGKRIPHVQGSPKVKTLWKPRGGMVSQAIINSVTQNIIEFPLRRAMGTITLNGSSRGCPRTMNCVCIEGRRFLTAAHLFHKVSSGSFKVQMSTGRSLTADYVECQISISNEFDLAVIQFPRSSGPAGETIKKFLQPRDNMCIMDHPDSYLISARRETELLVTNQLSVNELQIVAGVDYNHRNPNGELLRTYTIVDGYLYDAPTKAGDCGSLLVSGNKMVRSHVILGMHVAGDNNGAGMASCLTLEGYETLVENMDEEVKIVRFSGKPLETQGKEGTSLSKYLSTDTPIDFLGRFEYYHPRAFRSQIKRSPLFNVFNTTTKPVHFRGNDNHLDPLVTCIKKQSDPVQVFPQWAVDKATQHTLSEVKALKTSKCGKNILSIEEAINGCPADEWVQSMDFNTTAGYPYCIEKGRKGKTHILKNVNGYYVPRDDVLAEIEDIVFDFEERRGKPFIFLNHVKDERLPVSKVDAGKARVFTSIPFSLNVVVRMFNGAFCATTMENYLGPCTIGLNVHSPAWYMLWKRLMAKSDDKEAKCWIAGDFKNFDKGLPWQITDAVLNIIQGWYNDEHTACRETMFEMLFAGTYLSEDMLYATSHGVPSGVALTSVVNSWANVLLHKVCYLLLEERHVHESLALDEWDSSVAIATHGDDVIGCVKIETAPWFNMENIAECFGEFGITYTSCNKDEITDKFLNYKNVKFLNRHFVLEQGIMFAPLPLTTICDMVSWIKKSPDDIAATLSNLDDFYRELCHHGQEAYDLYSGILKEAIDDCGEPRLEGYTINQWKDWFDITYGKYYADQSRLVYNKNYYCSTVVGKVFPRLHSVDSSTLL